MFLTNVLHSDKGIKHDSKLTGQTHKVKKKDINFKEIM